MKEIRIGYDDNLGLPNDFAARVQCDIVSYHDLTQLINAFEKNALEAIFIPAGTLPYLKKYEIISQALFGPAYKDTLQTNFVTTKPTNTQNLVNYSLGRVNKYCTTSYWAPLIYLMKFLPKNTFLKFQDTDGFQDLLFKTAEGIIEGSMVWDIILEQNPIAADKVHLLFFMDDLPTPVLVAHSGFFLETLEKINQFKTTDTQAFFSGFQPPNQNSIKKFQLAMQQASEFYKISKL